MNRRTKVAAFWSGTQEDNADGGAGQMAQTKLVKESIETTLAELRDCYERERRLTDSFNTRATALAALTGVLIGIMANAAAGLVNAASSTYVDCFRDQNEPLFDGDRSRNGAPSPGEAQALIESVFGSRP